MQHEILDSVYNDDTQQISVFLGLKDVVEVNLPSTTVRSFTTSVVAVFGPGSTEMFLADVSGFPDEGVVLVNQSGSTSEEIVYAGKDMTANKLTGISNTVYTHLMGEFAASTAFGPGLTEIFLQDVSKFPNTGLVSISRGSITEETLTYTGRNLVDNTLTGIPNPTHTHPVGESAEPSFPGAPVEGLRWIRKVTEVFLDHDLEVYSSVLALFGPGDTTISLRDVSRLPNDGIVVVNRGSATEEIITYTGRDIGSNLLMGISNPVNTHLIGELVYPSVDIDFLGAFEIDLRPFGTTFPLDTIRGPVRYGRSTVTLNGVIQLRENIDFVVVNDFVDDITAPGGRRCVRTRLRFERGGQPRRFSPGERLDVIYEFFVQNTTGSPINWIQIYTSPGIVAWVQVYQGSVANIAFSTLESVERNVPPAGNIRITPPFSNTTFPPTPVKVVIPDVTLPVNVVTTQPVLVGSGGPTDFISVSDVSKLPALGTLLDATDDTIDRSVMIEGDIISYSDIDLVNKRLVGVGPHLAHPTGSVINFNGARYIRDVVKDAINRTTLRGQLEALGVDGGPSGPYYLEIKIKGGTGTFNLQPGTYKISYIGFDDNVDRGLHKDITTETAFENRDFTFERYENIVERQEVAEGLLGQTTSYRPITSGTNPIDARFDIP
jgi:hypothetical protein